MYNLSLEVGGPVNYWAVYTATTSWHSEKSLGQRSQLTSTPQCSQRVQIECRSRRAPSFWQCWTHLCWGLKRTRAAFLPRITSGYLGKPMHRHFQLGLWATETFLKINHRLSDYIALDHKKVLRKRGTSYSHLPGVSLEPMPVFRTKQ